jgi:hypothetical protein
MMFQALARIAYKITVVISNITYWFLFKVCGITNAITLPIRMKIFR